MQILSGISWATFLTWLVALFLLYEVGVYLFYAFVKKKGVSTGGGASQSALSPANTQDRIAELKKRDEESLENYDYIIDDEVEDEVEEEEAVTTEKEEAPSQEAKTEAPVEEQKEQAPSSEEEEQGNEFTDEELEIYSKMMDELDSGESELKTKGIQYAENSDANSLLGDPEPKQDDTVVESHMEDAEGTSEPVSRFSKRRIVNVEEKLANNVPNVRTVMTPEEEEALYGESSESSEDEWEEPDISQHRDDFE